MKFKKIMLVSIILLAILTVGAVSANDDVDFNETLTTANNDEVSIDASYDDEITSEDSGDLAASSENDVLKDDESARIDVTVEEEFSLDSDDDIAWIHLSVGVNEGFASVVDEFGNNLFESEVGSDSNWFADENDGHYICSIAPNDLDWMDVGEILTFSFSNDDIEISINYELSMYQGSAELMPLPNLYDFGWWMSEREFQENDWSRLCDVWYNDIVNDGTLTLKVEYDSDTRTYEKSIGDDGISWNLEDIDFIEECGDYKISLIYSRGNLNIILCEDHIFTLTELNYGTVGYVYIAYPFDVIRFNSEEDEEGESTYIKVYVNDTLISPGEDNPLRWTLEDLGIDEGGEYPITIIAFRGDETDIIEQFSYTLNVDENLYDVRLYSNELGVESWNMEERVLYVVYPEGMDKHFTMKIYEDEEFLFECDVDSSRNWTLDDLGIDRNGGFNVRLYAENEYGDEEQITDTWLNVNGIISQDNFNYWISTHECEESTESDLCQVWINNVDEGIIIISIENSNGDIETDEQSIDEDYLDWKLDDFGDFWTVGTYTINLTYSNGEKTIPLVENHTFKVTKLSYNICEDVYVANPFDVIRFYSEEDDDGEPLYDVKVYVNGEEREFGGENPYRWTLNDLEIEDGGEYDINIKVYEDGVLIDELSYILNVDDNPDELRLYTSPMNVESWEMDGPVLYLVYPDSMDETLTVRIYDDEDNIIKEYDVDSSRNWTLDELGIDHDGNYNIQLFNVDDEWIGDEWVGVWCIDGSKIQHWIWDEGEDGVLFHDNEGNVIRIYVPGGYSGKFAVIVDGTVLYTPKVYENEYVWDLETLNISAPGEYDVVVKLINDDGTDEILIDGTLNVVKFNNDTARIKQYRNYDDDESSLRLYCPENANLTLIVNIIEQTWNPERGENDYEVVDTIEIPIDSTFYNKWVILDDVELDIDLDSHRFTEIVGVKQNGEEIDFEEAIVKDDSLWFNIFDNDQSDGENFASVSFPFNREFGNATITITSGDFSFSRKISEMEYGWEHGCYVFYLSLDDVDSFDSLSDKDVITSVFTHENGKFTRWDCINKNDDCIKLYNLESHEGPFGDIYSYGLEIVMEFSGANEDDEDDEEGDEGEDASNYFASITVPDSFNATEGEISVVSGNNVIFSRSLSDFDRIYQYWIAGYEYFILLDELELENLEDKSVLNVALSSNGKILKNVTLVYREGDEGPTFHYYSERVSFSVHHGDLSNPEHAMGIQDGSFIEISIADASNVTDGTILITLDDGTVLLNKSLSSFSDSGYPYIADYDESYGSWSYTIMANETVYDNFPENQNITFTFIYGNNTITHKGIREGNVLKRVVVPDDILIDLFNIVISDDVLVNGSDFAVTIECIDANRQSIDFEVGGGYFSVYVNGVKVEDLGRINRYDGETELDLFRLCSLGDGVLHLDIFLADLGITENGVYDIKVTHTPRDDYNQIGVESDIYSNKVTLTSNVKANYTNESVEWLTGYGVDPILMYLDTYYGDINTTTGTITVLNSDNDPILTKNIEELSYADGRYFLKYSDFTNRNFGDKITVKYSDGNERNGETSLDVLWRDIEPTDFNTTVIDDLDDYYGNFINLDIPELINTGQIIVTIKFKNNHGSNISNMSVDTDFDSKAVYRFNVADIKANYGNDFALALYDLGFYEDNGNYDIDVKFTADNVNVLNVTSSSLNVEFLKDIIITINETSRYAHSEPFATVRVFEPVTAYGELYIDGKFYDKKSFERGLITFISSKDWTVGTHRAEVRVLNSEFGSILNSSAVEFETLAHSEDVTVEVSDEFGANEHVIVYITVPKAGNVTVQIDKAASEIRQLSEGSNQIDLGILPYGNHRLWIEYEEVLDDGNVTFYNNYHSFFVSDDGRWLIFPNPLVLNDDDTIIIDLGSDATGYVLIYIDEELVKNTTLVNGHAEYVVNESIFTDGLDSGVLGASNKEKYGKHTYKIFYSGDKTHEPITREGEFTVAYIFKDDLAYEYPYKESYDITVTLPGDANGQVRLTVNNNPQISQVTDGKATFTVGNLPLGEHDVFIEYLGGDYPESSYHAVLNISHYGVIGEYSDSAKYVSLLLPTNATGNLTVYNNDRKSILCSVPVVEGKARIDLSKVSVGIYDIRAYYEGDDYDVRDFEISFKVMPKVNITQNAIIDEDVVIFVDLDNATGFLLIIMDGLSPVLEELKDGIVNYTLKTENYSYGDHRVNFMYIGNSFNGDVFNEFNETTGRYVAIDYDMKILCQNLTSKTSSDGDEWLIVDCGNATGTLQVFLDGTLWQVVEIVNGLARINIAGLSNGEHNLTFLYSGDRKFGSALLSILLSVKHKVPRIDAGNFNIDYSSKKAYSVVVYKKDGSIASGVAVTFLINNKSYGNVLSNSKGVASIVISSAPGSYKITSKALGVSVTKQLNVKKVLSLKKVTVKRSAKKLVIKATLKKVDGKYLKGKKIIFKFKGKKYTAKTNKKGVAKVTIKKKVLKKLKKGKKVTYQATYLKDTVKRTVKVKK
ncbi:Ig-like domain-containing protein [Methanobrevibacter sp.]|uniref:Ig-like domain-containing protein n=1 Tax=Methanobrevibacter sp. TaxID=66852 RepID=UPI003869EC9F